MADDDPRLAAVWDAYRRAEPELGACLGRELTAAHPQNGAAWYALAACLERLDRLGEADRCFRRAGEAADDPQPPPYRTTWGRFRSIVDAAKAALPAQLAAAIGEVTLVLADYAEPELLADRDEPELLGLFTGHPRGDSQFAPGALSPRLYVFRRAHEHACTSRDEFAEEVRRTLLHEFGHYLGYGEDDLDELGMG